MKALTFSSDYFIYIANLRRIVFHTIACSRAPTTILFYPTDWAPFQQRQQSALADRQRVYTSPISSVRGAILEEREDDKMEANQDNLACNQLLVKAKAMSFGSDVCGPSQKAIQATRDEGAEEIEAEEDYPMLRLDYRLKYAVSFIFPCQVVAPPPIHRIEGIL